MPEKTLIAYGTKHGSTREVAEAIACTLTEHHLEVETLPAGRVDDLTPYGGVVLGGALYMGRWHPDAAGLLERHRHALSDMPLAVFAMGPRTMEEHEAESSRVEPCFVPYAMRVFSGIVCLSRAGAWSRGRRGPGAVTRGRRPGKRCRGGRSSLLRARGSRRR